jgi:Ca2+-binding EF-hand superfamily protein
VANQWLHKKVLMLGSTTKSQNVYSSVTKMQECTMHACDSFNTQWVIDSFDPNDRYERQGEPVKAGEAILIRHIQTGHYLASDTVVEKNDFGSEYEVMCHSFAGQNKTQNLELEKKGNITTDVPTRYQNVENVWMFETAPDASHDQPIDQLQKFNIKDLLADLEAFFKATCTPDKVKACFSAIDAASSGKLDSDDFRWGMIDLGYQLNKMEAEELCAHFGGGDLDYNNFIAQLC